MTWIIMQRLGFNAVRSLATALATRQMPGSQAARFHQDVAAQLWEHTAHVASLAQVIASGKETLSSILDKSAEEVGSLTGALKF
ncbi:MAG: HDOD domain-containing protein [Proteobacteria bacterium]|nr:HDOD domain-containing protein [Pseudomonadota bacterium]